MTGTVIGQIAALLLAPVITRLFTTADLAGLEQYTMLLAILSIVVTGKYEFAVMNPPTKEDARIVVKLALMVATGVCVVMLFVSLSIDDVVADYYQNESLGSWLWTLPIALFALAVFNTLNYWFTRQKKFRVAAVSKVWSTSSGEPLKVLSGLAHMGPAGLYLSTLIGNVLAALYCYFRFLKEEPRGLRDTDRSRMKELATEYSDYPLFSIWGSVLNRLAQWAHIGMFSHYYGIVAVGLMALCRRIVLAPLNLVSNSYSQVFYQRISDITDPELLRAFYRRNLVRFLFLAVGIVIIVHLLPDSTMAFAFGEEWAASIDYLRILIFWFALNFVTSSLAFITYRIRIQKVSFILDAIHFAFIYGSIWYAFHSGMNEIEALKTFVAMKVIYFVLNIIVVLFYVNRYNGEKETSS